MSIDPGSIEFDTYELVLLRRTRQSREFDDQTQERIFREHAATRSASAPPVKCSPRDR